MDRVGLAGVGGELPLRQGDDRDAVTLGQVGDVAATGAAPPLGDEDAGDVVRPLAQSLADGVEAVDERGYTSMIWASLAARVLLISPM